MAYRAKLTFSGRKGTTLKLTDIFIAIKALTYISSSTCWVVASFWDKRGRQDTGTKMFSADFHYDFKASCTKSVDA